MLDPVRASMKQAENVFAKPGARPTQAQELAAKRKQQAQADARTRGPGVAGELAAKQRLAAAANAKTLGKRK